MAALSYGGTHLNLLPSVMYSYRRCLRLCSGETRCAEVPLSVDSSVNEANLTVTAETSDVTPPYRFQRHAVVGIRHNNLFTFIETDKPVYKPSDTGAPPILPAVLFSVFLFFSTRLW